MNPTITASLICLGAVFFEAAMSGGSPRARLAELRQPPLSPSFTAWILIGLAYYALCFVLLRHLLIDAGSSALHGSAIALLIIILFLNGLWNCLFFRVRTLRGSFFLLIPYAAVVVTLAGMLISMYPLGAMLVGCYSFYLFYATWWTYRLWRLNRECA